MPAFREMLTSLTLVIAKTVLIVQTATPTFAPTNMQERKPCLLLPVAEKIVVFTYSLIPENSFTSAVLRH